MKFENRPNKSYIVNLGNGIRKEVWESRSVAVNSVILVLTNKSDIPYVLASKRGPNSADYQGKMNLIAGYLDWDEYAHEAVIRETWEECGLNILNLLSNTTVLANHMKQPWFVNTSPLENRQNVSLRYGCLLKLNISTLPKLSLDNNEVEGEIEEAMWIPVNKIDKYDWAFNHDSVIKEYLSLIKQNLL